MASFVLTRRPPAALVIAAAGAAAILGAYFFQYVLKLAPCPLCLEQRIPYYVAIPLALILAARVLWGAPRGLVRAGFAALVLIMLVGAGLGVYHAGIEWKWWLGPTECSGELPRLDSAADLMKQMQATSVVRCDQAAWRFLGLSLAGYNVLISLVLAGVALGGMRATKDRAVRARRTSCRDWSIFRRSGYRFGEENASKLKVQSGFRFHLIGNCFGPDNVHRPGVRTEASELADGK